ncbi:MAG: TlpA family protein disulfide reductase [Deltaproteobacteria bacterium]|nr:TlpA family protein disulfide reductase [Deltaproteobacteria bacterium]
MESSLSLRKTFFLSIIVVFIGAGPAVASIAELAQNANIFMYPKPHQISDLVLKGTSGQVVSLSNFRGRVVLLHFWSINCPACRVEEPMLHRVKQMFGPSGLEVLAVNLVDPPTAVAHHAVTNRTPFPVLFDGGGGFDLKVVSMAGKKTAFVVNPRKEAILEVPGFPTTYIVDVRGNAVGYSVGPARWDNANAQALIQRLVSESKPIGMPGTHPNGVMRVPAR